MTDDPGTDAATSCDATDRPRIVVVGPCASGKTTLVSGLRDLGYNATVCGQEHSAIPMLWRHTEPDIVIALHAELATIRQRRGTEWPEWLYDLQIERLKAARDAASIRIDTSSLDRDAALATAARHLPPR